MRVSSATTRVAGALHRVALDRSASKRVRLSPSEHNLDINGLTPFWTNSQSCNGK
jgi:hypothetical protein